MEHVHRVAALDEVYVRVAGNILDNELGSFDLAHGDDTRSRFLDCLTNHVGALSVTFGSDDRCACLFLLPLHDELGSLGILLRHLLLLNRSGEFPRE